MSCGSSTAQSQREVLEVLLEQERAALDSYYGASDPSQYAAMLADEVTTFDPWSNGRLDDTVARENLLALAGTIPSVSYQIVNPRVDLYGDAAVFTFNVELADPVGDAFATWNTTEIHHRTADGWELVHSHWSFASPPPEPVDS